MIHENIYIYSLDGALLKKCNVITTAAEFLETSVSSIYNSLYRRQVFQDKYYISKDSNFYIPKQKPDKAEAPYYIYNSKKQLQYVASSKKSAAEYITEFTGHKIKNVDAYIELNTLFRGILYISDKHIYKFDKPVHPIYKGFEFKFEEDEKINAIK